MSVATADCGQNGESGLLTRSLSLVLVALVLLLAGCASLPPLEPRTSTSALLDTSQTQLGRALATNIAANPGSTGVHAVPDPRDAFAARVALAAAAERSLDAQYYIWHDDHVGILLFEALWRAAERGVRVRLLLDDANTKGLDSTIATLDAHPNIEVRLYNPLVERESRLLNFVGDFARVNRRMHNKSFTVDNQVTIVGGRNIGDEYFGAGTGATFTDLDVIAVGAAVREVSKEFDLYWNSASAYAAASFVGGAGSASVTELESRFKAVHDDPEAVDYIEAVRTTPLLQELIERKLSFEWTTARLVYDDPAKTLERTEKAEDLLITQLMESFGAHKTLDLVSPYFIPGEGGTAALVALAKRGVRVRVLTNSLASSEAAVVHSGYAKRRDELLRGGIQLYELKPVAGQPRGTEKVPGPSAGSALHAKTYAVDGAKIFVGSFNFDQRSAHLNTEMGLVIDSASLAQRLSNAFDTVIPISAWEVRLGQNGAGLEWVERTSSGGQTVYAVEPATDWFRRFRSGFMAIMPIEWLL